MNYSDATNKKINHELNVSAELLVHLFINSRNPNDSIITISSHYD